MLRPECHDISAYEKLFYYILDNFLLQLNEIKRHLQTSIDELNHVRQILHTEKRFERQLEFRLYTRFLQRMILKLSKMTLKSGVETLNATKKPIKIFIKSQAVQTHNTNQSSSKQVQTEVEVEKRQDSTTNTFQSPRHLNIANGNSSLRNSSLRLKQKVNSPTVSILKNKKIITFSNYPPLTRRVDSALDETSDLITSVEASEDESPPMRNTRKESKVQIGLLGNTEDSGTIL